MFSDTRQKIVDVARSLLQTKGFNAFSYADISSALKITKASIHYHFPTKAALGLELVKQYRLQYNAGVAQVEAQTQSAKTLLQAYFAFHQTLANESKLCVCVMLASETESLDQETLAEVQGYFSQARIWLANVLERGRTVGELTFRGSPKALASRIQAAIEGAIVLALALRDPARVTEVYQGILADIES